MQQTVFHAWHLANHARMTEFAGWDMPIQYSDGPIKEHELTRRSVGIFDISHMGRILVTGAGSGAWLSTQLSACIDTIPVGKAQYSLLITDDGHIVDDLFVYHLPPSYDIEAWMIVVNASNHQAAMAQFESGLPAEPNTIRLRDVSEAWAMLAVQGPNAARLLDRVGEIEEDTLGHHENRNGQCISTLPRAHIVRTTIAGRPVLSARTGYTGEDGFELLIPRQDALSVLDLLMQASKGSAIFDAIECGPVGLAARDSLRFEAGMPLFGHELTSKSNPWELGLGWAVDLNHQFRGRTHMAQIQNSAPTKKLVTIVVQGGVPREHYPIMTGSGSEQHEIGSTTSGMFCPTLKQFACNALVPIEFAAIGTLLYVMIRGTARSGNVVARPLYIPAWRR